MSPRISPHPRGSALSHVVVDNSIPRLEDGGKRAFVGWRIVGSPHDKWDKNCHHEAAITNISLHMDRVRAILQVRIRSRLADAGRSDRLAANLRICLRAGLTAVPKKCYHENRGHNHKCPPERGERQCLGRPQVSRLERKARYCFLGIAVHLRFTAAVLQWTALCECHRYGIGTNCRSTG
jgi:hypothetical protein